VFDISVVCRRAQSHAYTCDITAALARTTRLFVMRGRPDDIAEEMALHARVRSEASPDTALLSSRAPSGACVCLCQKVCMLMYVRAQHSCKRR